MQVGRFFTNSIFILLAAVVGVFISCVHAPVSYENKYSKKVAPFLAAGHQFKFKSHDNLDLQGVTFKHPKPLGTIIFLNGRTETWLKYGETFYDLYHQGFSIISYDHRGQGLSPRLIPGNPQIGHVEKFEDYVLDFYKFLETVVQPMVPSNEKLFVIAHSLGGPILARCLETKNVRISAVIFSAPLFQIYTQPNNEESILKTAKSQIDSGKGSEYFPGRGDYNPTAPFAANPLTTSEMRFKLQAQISKDYPNTIIGGQSSRWMYETIQATKNLIINVNQVTTPILLFQAGNDRIADPARQEEYCAKAKACVKRIYPLSKHHFFLESDEIRDSVLKETVDFFSKVGSGTS